MPDTVSTNSHNELGETRVAPNWAFAKTQVEQWQAAGEVVVFTNGCFDLLHAGHVTYLQQARALGSKLVVGLNSDQSVKQLKGPTRPLQHEQDRALILAGLRAVDLVVCFAEETPLELISLLQPKILVKGGDYTPETIVGAEMVQAIGGEVRVLPFLPGRSTSAIIARSEGKKVQG